MKLNWVRNLVVNLFMVNVSGKLYNDCGVSNNQFLFQSIIGFILLV